MRAADGEDLLAGYVSGPAAATEATAVALARAGAARAVVLVEGVSDQIAVETLAARRGRDLPAEGIVVVPVGGAHGVARYLRRFGPEGAGARIAGLCDAGEVPIVARGLAAAGLAAPGSRADLGRAGFFVCVEDLEDELIRAAGPARVTEAFAAHGDLGAFRTIQRQPAWRGRDEVAQMRRFLGAGSRRKLRYARLLAEAIDLDRTPRPLAGLLAAVGGPGWPARALSGALRHYRGMPRSAQRLPRRHDHDAGGPADLLAAKAALREEVWEALRAAKVARFPGAVGRIPNFTGAEAAARRLAGLPAWAQAATVKANPDSPQLPVRQRALEDGKTLYMAVPRLAEPEPFFALDPDHLDQPPRKAASISGATRSARRVSVSELSPVDLVVMGSVAAAADGARLGKGGGFADLEFALATAAGLIGPATILVTTVHEVQVRPAGDIPVTSHDVPVDLIVTPERVIDCRGGGRQRPAGGIEWADLTEEKIAAIPLLAALRAARLA